VSLSSKSKDSLRTLIVRIRAYLSINHYNPLCDKLLPCFPLPITNVRASGCAHKMMGIVRGSGDCMLYPNAGANMWDVGPGTVIMKALGGYVAGINGTEYSYGR